MQNSTKTNHLHLNYIVPLELHPQGGKILIDPAWAYPYGVLTLQSSPNLY